MSLVNEFKVTLRDFVPPELSDHVVLTDHRRGTVTTVTNRLYAKLRAYADLNRLPLNSIVEQLREETYRC